MMVHCYIIYFVICMVIMWTEYVEIVVKTVEHVGNR